MHIRHFLKTTLFALTLSAVPFSCLQADAVSGPQFADRMLGRNTYDRFNPILFQGGRQAVISVESKSSVPLSFGVYTSDGVLIRSVVVYGFTKSTIWFDPPFTAYYSIVVTNLSPIYAGEYLMRTN